MSQKKISATKTQNQQKAKNTVYIERFREIEVYLTLLTRPFLSSIIPNTSVGNNHIFDKVESEIKEFIELKLQELTGLSGGVDGASFSKEEVNALKLVASTVLHKGKNNVGTDRAVAERVGTPESSELSDVQTGELDDTDLEEESNVEHSFENAEVEVNVIQSNRQEEDVEPEPVKVAKKTTKAPLKKKAPVIPPTQVPDVTFGNPTDTMKRVRPKGIKPLPQPSPEQAAQMASAQAEAAQAALLSAQLNQAATIMPDNLGMPNFDAPLFR
jgi:hypothetical protein